METKWIQLSNNNSGLECITLFSFPLQLFHLIEYAFYNSLPQRDPSLTSACSRIPNNPFYASVACVLYWYQLPLTSLLLASRPTRAFPNTSQSFPCIEQLLPQHDSRRPFFLKYIFFTTKWMATSAKKSFSARYKSSPSGHTAKKQGSFLKMTPTDRPAPANYVVSRWTSRLLLLPQPMSHFLTISLSSPSPP